MMIKQTIVALALLIPGLVSAQVFQCKDANTGSTVFSDTPCGNNAQSVKIQTSSPLDFSRERQAVIEEKIELREIQASNQRYLEQVSKEEDRKRKELELKEMCSPHNELVKAGLAPEVCGIEKKKKTPQKIPVQATERPRIITNCVSLGCYDNYGLYYSKGAGNTYFPSNGGVCQRIGTYFHCH